MNIDLTNIQNIDPKSSWTIKSTKPFYLKGILFIVVNEGVSHHKDMSFVTIGQSINTTNAINEDNWHRQDGGIVVITFPVWYNKCSLLTQHNKCVLVGLIGVILINHCFKEHVLNKKCWIKVVHISSSNQPTKNKKYA